MSDSNPSDARRELLRRFMHAWNTHDLDALMGCMTDDCVFYASAGTGTDGATFRGRDAVRGGYARIFVAFPDAQWSSDIHSIDGDRAFSEWTFSGTQSDGRKIVVRGMDAFELKGDLIAVKDSYRKQVTAG